MRRLTKKQALEMFKTEIAPLIREQYGRDSIAMREAFNDFVDRLNKDRQITDHQAFNWTNPY